MCQPGSWHSRYSVTPNFQPLSLTLTPGWMAPELLHIDDTRPQVDEKADVYSFGVVLYQLISGAHDPYPNLKHPMQIGMAVIQGKRPSIPTDCPEELIALVQQSWHQNPNSRPSFKQIVEALNELPKYISGTLILSKSIADFTSNLVEF